MDQVRHWWSTTLKGILTWLGDAWQWLLYSITERWEISYFVLGVAVILCIALVIFWHRGH